MRDDDLCALKLCECLVYVVQITAADILELLLADLAPDYLIYLKQSCVLLVVKNCKYQTHMVSVRVSDDPSRDAQMLGIVRKRLKHLNELLLCACGSRTSVKDDKRAVVKLNYVAHTVLYLSALLKTDLRDRCFYTLGCVDVFFLEGGE